MLLRENNPNGRWSGGQAGMPSAFLLCLLLHLHLLFRADTEPRVRGVHRLGWLNSGPLKLLLSNCL